jgi:hypothetical protein
VSIISLRREYLIGKFVRPIPQYQSESVKVLVCVL